jgi:hypothetical protein
LINTDATATQSVINFGGNVANVNSATHILFFTGATTTTLAGTRRMTIAPGGNIMIGNNSNVPTYNLSFDGISVQTIGVERNTTVGSSGSNFTNSAGGCYNAVATANLNGGIYQINSGASSGRGFSSVRLGSLGRSLSGTTGNTTIQDRFIIPSEKNLVDAANDTLFSFSVASGDSLAGAIIHYGVEVETEVGNLDNKQVETGQIFVSAYVRDKTVAHNITSTESPLLSTGTLSKTLDVLYSAGKIYVIVNFDSSLNPAAGVMKFRYTATNTSKLAITQY